MFSLFDCHCDTLTTALEKSEQLYDNSLHLSFKRLEDMDKAGQVFAVWLDDKYLDNAFESTIRALDFFENQIEKNKDIIKRVENANDFEENKIYAVLSVEGGEAIENDVDNIDRLYERGIRLFTLTWNRENNLGYGGVTGINKPLKPFGIRALKRLEEKRIIVDVSHLNEAGFESVCENTKRPFIASHSNAYSLCSHCRNLKDWQLEAIKQTGSMVGINLFPEFLSDGDRAGTDDILRHTDYIGSKIGEDKLCLGCDFDGIDKTPEGISNVSELKVLYNAFEKSFGKNTAHKIFFANLKGFICDMI